MEREHPWPMEAVVAETRATVTHIATDLAEMRREFRGDIRRLDDRLFRLMLLTLATLATVIASLVAALLT
jgi:hypothetical protein